jgi:hypothetical protein
MGCNMVVALGGATVDGHTLFGHATSLPEGASPALALLAARAHAADETLRLGTAEVPQARQTHRVLCIRAAGLWGAYHGVNEHAVAAGVLPLQTRLAAGAGLSGTDLVRLVLERARSARQGVDLLADLLTRHGQAGDGAFLIADATEAFAVETAGRWWVYQEVQELRSQTEVCTVRQDWDRIAPGLSGHVIGQGWWPDDGSKIDFAGVVCPDLLARREALQRWGRATAHLGQQNGHIDVAFVRHLLGGRLDETDDDRPDVAPATELVTNLACDPSRLRVVWVALGPPSLGLAFPCFLEGSLPLAFTAEAGADSVGAELRRLCDHLDFRADDWDAARDAMARLQARFDQEAEEFAAERSALANQPVELQRQAELFLEHCLEQFREVSAGLLASRAERGLALSR